MHDLSLQVNAKAIKYPALLRNICGTDLSSKFPSELSIQFFILFFFLLPSLSPDIIPEK